MIINVFTVYSGILSFLFFFFMTQNICIAATNCDNATYLRNKQNVNVQNRAPLLQLISHFIYQAALVIFRATRYF